MKRIRKVNGWEIAFHIGFLLVSIVAAYFLQRSGVVQAILIESRSYVLLSSFIAGIFYTWILTIAPATVTFFEIATHTSSIIPMALLGGLGAVIGDLLIFRFLKFSIGDDLMLVFHRASQGTLHKLVKIKVFSITLAILGAIIIASPLPDELGLALLEASNVKMRVIAGVSFVFNAIGILIIGLIARGVLSG